MCRFEAGRLLTFSAFRMGAYSRRALIRINTVCEFELKFKTFKKSFCWHSNLSNDRIISDGQKWLWILETVSETGVENDKF